MAEGERSDDDWRSCVASPGREGEAARSELRVHLVTRLRRVLAVRGVPTDLCEDFAQEALLRVQERLDQFKGESRFTTWASAIAVRIAFDELRHRRWRDVSFDVHQAAADERFEAATQEQHIGRERVLAALRDAIEQGLTARQRTLLSAELEGMPHSEIASRMNMTRGALYKLGHDARKKIKAHLAALGLDEGELLAYFD